MARILVVDDDNDILKLAETVLGSEGHTVFTALDALRAIDFLNQYSFDLLLSDANMPMYSGFELVNTIRNDNKFDNMSVAMLTGLKERKDVERAIKMGVDDYIVKPIDPLILVQKINSLFDKRPPQNYPEISLVDTNMGRGEFRTAMIIEAVSELGARVLSPVVLKPGAVIDIHSDFFKALDVEPPPLKVLSVEIDSSGQCRAQCIFMGAQEAMLQKIRRWLYSHRSTTKSAA